jgi:DNA-binding HxlR family transcriptional regulator
MLGSRYDDQVCSVARALEVVGERWTLLIVRNLFRGAHRFEDFAEDLGVTRGILSARLRRLEEEGVVERRPYQERPVRWGYWLTPKGRRLWPVIMHLGQWGDEFYPEPSGTPIVVEHRDCGGRPDDHLCCDRCGARLAPGDVTARPGPGGGTGWPAPPRRVAPSRRAEAPATGD